MRRRQASTGLRDKQEDAVLAHCRSCGGEMYEGSVGVDFGGGVMCEECCQSLSAFQLALLSGAQYVELTREWVPEWERD